MDTEIQVLKRTAHTEHWADASAKSRPLTFDAVEIANVARPKEKFGILHYAFPSEDLVNYKDKETEREWTFGSYGTEDASNAAILSGNVSDRAWEQFRIASDKLDVQCEALLKVGKSTKRRRLWDVEGSELDIDRVLSLDDNCWVRTKRDAKARVVRLGINSAISCGNDESGFAKLAGLAAGLANVLTRLGYGVELWDVCALEEGGCYEAASKHLTGNYSKGKWIVGTTLMKASDEPIDAARIMACSIPGRFRNNTFAVLRSGLGAHSGLGRCTDLPDEVVAFAGLDAMISVSWGRDEHHQAVQIAGLLSRIQGTKIEPKDGAFVLGDE